MPAVLLRVRDMLRAGTVRLFVAWDWEQGEPASAEPLLAELARLGAVVEPDWVALWQFAAPDYGLAHDDFWDESVQLQPISWSR